MNIAKFDSRFATIAISKIVEENAITKTFIFEYPLGGLPGQFLMMWLPGIDEKPMSVAYDDGKEFWVTICKVGPFSEAMHGLKVGDRVGIRGPLGTHYEIGEGDHLVLVAGGYGAAPMYFVANQAVLMGCQVDFILGARNKDLLLYPEKILGLGENVKLHIATNDGSLGHKGFVTEVLDEVLAENGGAKGKGKINKVFTCGPEVMMKAVGDVCDKYKVKAWMSMEKYMKCGVGVCGQCALDDTGDLVCKDGPVMSFDYLRKLPEMGKYHRDGQGKKHYF
ncbi:dihydroorotate dehydrogenase electron transfer subunit [Candidatus Peregrinibacteria bacterium]|nr:dihydroorotate dehydrogenase electron transfer subunit [Candidatus Peregrinibacteria bacterium]